MNNDTRENEVNAAVNNDVENTIEGGPVQKPDEKQPEISGEKMLEMVKGKAEGLGRIHVISNDGDASSQQHIIRVKSDSHVERLAFHIVNTIKEDGVAICQAIGAAANQRVDLAVIAAQSIVVRYNPTSSLVCVGAIRKPKMDNGDERTAIRKRIFPISSSMLR